MEILSLDESQQRMAPIRIEVVVKTKWDELANHYGPFKIPLESGRQMALAKLFAYYLASAPSLCIYVTSWGINTTIEHLDLYYGYTRSIVGQHSLIAKPVHWFKSGEEDRFISILGLVILFSWDAWIMDQNGSMMMRFSHDGWFEIKAAEKEWGGLVQGELNEYGVSSFGA